MNVIPELSDDAVIDVAREGGFAYIPKLAEPRRITLAQLNPAQRESVCNVLRQALPLGEPQGEQCQAGKGDRRYYRIAISYATQQQAGNIVILIPEELAPPELVRLWQDGR
ncbi:protealysin inhibitor emfourin [Pantoea sp. BAV 3049]|uniref:protealysin inhibitor emfourin n=1 Tax=Pantoea sp. BAV 3049 TaxID=2654188 RepID=UPI00131BD6A6|nr:protealysin inhibitor emfourin [Pantoea sp. BAV 3049]